MAMHAPGQGPASFPKVVSVLMLTDSAIESSFSTTIRTLFPLS